MDSERRVLNVDGETIREGTSLFDVSTENVLWYDSVQNGMVQLETVAGHRGMPIEEFKTHIKTEEILIEAPPAGYSE